MVTGADGRRRLAPAVLSFHVCYPLDSDANPTSRVAEGSVTMYHDDWARIGTIKDVETDTESILDDRVNDCLGAGRANSIGM
jgi:hypothetical protein